MENRFITIALSLLFAGNILAVNCQRSIHAISAKEIKIDVVINKEQLSSFARLAETIPVGSVIKYAKSEGGRLTVQDNKVKIIWLTLPQQSSITVSYIVSTDALKEGNYTISGNFSYVDGGLTKEIQMPVNNFTINSEMIANIDPTIPAFPANNSDNAVNKVNAATEETLKNDNNKITYAIQFLSTKDKLPEDYFARNKGVQQVKVETVNGVNKYIMGTYRSTAEAISGRDSLVKKGFNDAFVVAYKNNKRITLEEAKQSEAGK